LAHSLEWMDWEEYWLELDRSCLAWPNEQFSRLAAFCEKLEEQAFPLTRCCPNSGQSQMEGGPVIGDGLTTSFLWITAPPRPCCCSPFLLVQSLLCQKPIIFTKSGWRNAGKSKGTAPKLLQAAAHKRRKSRPIWWLWLMGMGSSNWCAEGFDGGIRTIEGRWQMLQARI